MKKITLLMMFVFTCFTYGQTVTKTYTPPSSITVDGCGTYCVTLPGVSFTAADFPLGGIITDLNVSISWLKTDGSCGFPGTGNSYHSETNFRVNGPTSQSILAAPNTWSGGANSPPVTTIFDQAAASAPSGTPVNGTFLPSGGNLNIFNCSNPIGTWSLSAGDTAGADPLCVSSYSITITVAPADIIAPVITCPGPITVSNDAGVCDAVVNYTTPVGTDTCPGTVTVQTAGLPSGSTFPLGTTTNTFLATDASGNTATCSFDVTVNDTENPVITCPGNITQSNDAGQCGAVVNYAVSGTDNCTGILGQSLEVLYVDNYSNNATELPNELSSDGHNVTVVLNEDSNGWSTLNGDLSPYDLIVWNAQWGYQAPASTFNNIEAWVQAGGNILVTGYDVVFSPEIHNFLGGSSGSDFGGNNNLTVLGPGNSLTTGLYNIVGTSIFGISDWDSLNGPYTPETVDIVGAGRWTLRTMVGGGQIAWLTGYYSQDGKWSTPGSGYYEAMKNFAYNTSSSVSIIQTAGLPSGSVFPVGTTTNTFVATDASGNTATCSFDVTVNDTENPTWTVAPADMTVECDGVGNTADFSAWLTSFSGSDNCGTANVTNNSLGLSNGCGNTGTETVTFTLDDGNGNSIAAAATFTIVDTTVPTIDVAASDLTVECDGAGNVTELTNWLSSIGTTGAASDICGGVTWTNDFTALSNGCGNTGAALVTFTATDDCGNFSTTQATFTIVDTTVPTIDVAASDLTVECDGAGNVTDLTNWLSSIGTTGAASDICAGITWSNDFTALSDDCGATGSALVTFTATDECGNFSTTQATFTIADTTPALIACPGDVTAIADPGSCGAIVIFQPAVALEECGWVIVAQTGGLGSGSVFPVGDTVVEFTATDECFNTSTCTFTITVEDTEAPVVNCNDLTVQLDEFGTASITAEDVDGVSTDNCGIATLSIDVDTFDCSNVGANTVVLTVTDVHGNAATCSATVTVEDITPPEVFCQDLTVALDANGTAVITGMDMDAGSTDACGIGSYELSMDTFDCNYIGNNTVTLYVTDVNGNMSSCTATVTVEDNLAPTLVCTDVTIELGPDGITYISPSDLATVEDPCGVVVFEADLTQVSCADIGAPITVSVFAIDSNGNPSFCSSTITVVDLLEPAIVCPPNEVVIVEPNGTYTLGDYIADGIATVTDNCSDPVTIFTQSPAAGTLLGYGIHDITFTAEDEYGNVATCSFELNIQELLGTSDNELGSLVLYPNPANNQVYLSNPSQLELNEVIIYDLTGRMVNRVDLSNMGLEKIIDISSLANATYMVIINGDQGTTTKQLIVGN